MSTSIARDHHERLSAELAQLRTQMRTEARRRLEAALEASGGVRTEAVEAAEQECELLEARINSLDGHLRRAKVTEGDADPGSAGLGSRVTVRRQPAGPSRTYTLVLPLAGDPRNGLLAVDSPMGQALLGRRAGDEVTVTGPGGTRTLVVEDVEP